MSAIPLYLVTSLSHSGSTVLSMALACHPDVVSLGEIFQVLREPPDTWLRDETAHCSCGDHASRCPIWAPALDRIRSEIPQSDSRYANMEDKYAVVMEQFQHHYGNQRFAVDTSKGVRHLQYIGNNPRLAPKSIFLLKDVRSYAYSQVKLARSQNRQGLRKAKQYYWFQMLKWYFGNKRRQKLLERQNIPYTQIGYEPFCFSPAAVTRQLCDFAGLKYSEQMPNLADPEHHILFGNPMRLDSAKQRRVEYDACWLQQTGHIVPAALMPFVMKYNKQRVYPINFGQG